VHFLSGGAFAADSDVVGTNFTFSTGVILPILSGGTAVAARSLPAAPGSRIRRTNQCQRKQIFVANGGAFQFVGVT
jgi:hypothetical protein